MSLAYIFSFSIFPLELRQRELDQERYKNDWDQRGGGGGRGGGNFGRGGFHNGRPGGGPGPNMMAGGDGGPVARDVGGDNGPPPLMDGGSGMDADANSGGVPFFDDFSNNPILRFNFFYLPIGF